MPQAHTVPVDVPNLDFISGRQRFDSYGSYGSSSYKRERTYSLPTRPVSPGRRESTRERQRKDGDPDDDPLARMRSNLERTTFLLSKMRVTDLGPEPEEIRILPPKEISRHHSEPTTHSKSYSQSHSSQNVRSAPRFRAVATQMERVDSTSTNTSLATQFTLDVSTYSYSGPPSKDEDHGTEFHQIINHGRLYNPSRGNMINHGPTSRRAYEHTSSPLAKTSKSGHHGKGREEEEDVGEAPTSPGLVEGRYGLRAPRHSKLPSHSNRHSDHAPRPEPAPPAPTRPRTLSRSKPRPDPNPTPPPPTRSSSKHTGDDVKPSKIRSRPFPSTSHHGRSVSISHPPPALSEPRKRVASALTRRVRFDM
ncbi:hypothetical protein DFP72DRAFT_938051 [Ephemerocybe angulata]|uniref:Uncharacterized protein n=1 Tax=Ephemerocybe angulata TaxID=980116 RepID=A0A8H6HAE5_9AGAR|nr:hypothetical protein DFP72DRAFT_938051 [Tulosesus angulatus]